MSRTYRRKARLGRHTRWPFVTTLALTFFVSSPDLAQDVPVPSNTRQPIVTNQFSTTTSGALHERAPGLYIQQAIAVNQGTASFWDGGPEPEISFFRETFEEMFQMFIDEFSNILTSLDLFISMLSGLPSGSTSPDTFIPISNAATTGQGTTVQIE